MDEDENVDLVSNEEDDLEESIIYRTYRMDFQNKRIIGMIDGLEATGQGMFKALQTRRYAYEIYDDQYGSDIMNKLGKPWVKHRNRSVGERVPEGTDRFSSS